MTTLPRAIPLLSNATLADGSRVDVEISGDIVTAVRAAGTSTPRTDAIDLSGYVLVTAPAEPHAHLDKALSWDLIDPPMGDLSLAIDSWVAYSQTMTVDDIAERARRQALTMLSHGTTAIRCHVDMLRGPDPLRGSHALLRVREELRDLIDIELVVLSSEDIPDETIEAALTLGLDLVGGAPHLAAEPFDELRRLLAIAARRGVGVDLHTDETLTGAPTLPEFARIVRSWPKTQPVSAGHCVRLGTLEPDDLAEVITEVLASDIGIICLPITNLYLQGWNDPVAMPRGITALRTLLDRGVRVAAGADNVRDPFNPVGRSDALETASLLVSAGHLTLTEAYAAVSSGARSVMNLPMAGVAVGARAELLAVRGTGIADVIANASPDRYVIHAGRLVAHSSVQYHVATPASAPILELR